MPNSLAGGRIGGHCAAVGDSPARAGERFITEHTVSNYLFNIYNKLGISSRVELVLYIMKQREAHAATG